MTDKQEIEQVLKNITDTFSGLDVAAWLENFHNPRLIVLPDTCYSPSNESECRDMLGPYFQRLKESGFNRTSLDQHQIRFLTETTAIVSTVWTRFADDALLENFGATYLFQKSKNKWGVIMVTVHPADVMLVE